YEPGELPLLHAASLEEPQPHWSFPSWHWLTTPILHCETGIEKAHRRRFSLSGGAGGRISAVASDSKSSQPSQREWSAHFWEGCDVQAWWRLLIQNRFAVHWSKLYVAASVTFVSVGHTILRLVQNATYGRIVRQSR